MNSEREIVWKIAEGDPVSFGQVFRLYYNRLYYFAFHYLNEEEAAKDTVQDVFSVIWEERHKLAAVKNLSSWLFSLTKNHCLKKIDRLAVQQQYANLQQYRYLDAMRNALYALDTSPAAFKEISEIVNRTLSGLPGLSRRIFEQSRFDNKKNAEIAAELQISIKTVEAHITRTLQVFRKALKNYLPLLFFLFK